MPAFPIRLRRSAGVLLVALLPAVLGATSAGAQTPDAIRAQVARQRQPLLDTLRDLVEIESGSSDYEGLTRLSESIAQRLRALGGAVEFVDPPADHPRFENTPARLGRMVQARFTGRGTRKILLLAHMDTVYARGALAQQPFRIDGDRAYGLGIEDDKQGVAVILHTLATLKALNVTSYGRITVLINADEEVSSAGSRAVITKLGAEHDVVFSCESGGESDEVTLATAGIGAVQLRVKGRASHAGAAPEAGRNAVYELMHQVMRTRDLSDPATGVKMNWTLVQGGSARNVIPAEARATADVRVLRVEDYDRIERAVRERMRDRLIPDTEVSVVLERTRPPMPLREPSLRVAAQARAIYQELGRTLTVEEQPTGGGTDAAFAALQTQAPVIEGLGLLGAGGHTNDREYVTISSIEPRLYLLTRLISDLAAIPPRSR